MRTRALLLLAFAALAAGCHTPYREHPLAFQATALDGGAVDAQALRGKPWVIALWMPG